ncbi:MAG: protein phosphatase 2C domain-containing protein [Nanoarchaeota archaeon]|nr:protein phosphatase 2C domain-containing protein [Nanoarchaeota archaeon]
MRIEKVYNRGIKKINEDEYLIKNNLFAVFDGASSLVKFEDKHGKTGGKIASNTAKKIFIKNNLPLKQLAIEANNNIMGKMIKYKIDISDTRNYWTTCLAGIRIKKDKIECVQIGDSAILIIYKNGKYKLPLGYHDHDRETMIKWKELADNKCKNIFKKLKSQIDKVRRQTNITYGALNGDKRAIKFIKTKTISNKNIKSIVLFTDGLLVPNENPKNIGKFDKFIEIINKEGIKSLLKYVRKIEKDDPNCWKYPRFKQHDDATAIMISFGD